MDEKTIRAFTPDTDGIFPSAAEGIVEMGGSEPADHSLVYRCMCGKEYKQKEISGSTPFKCPVCFGVYFSVHFAWDN